MYIMALYIGLVATVLSYLYLVLLPIYASQILAGQQADEIIWWRCLQQLFQHSPPIQFMKWAALALAFGIFLAFCVLHSPWVQNAWVNLLAMTGWLGLLWFLARIDHLCFILPDVLTQSLLWLGLALMFWRQDLDLRSLLLSLILIYVVARALNALAAYYVQQHLFGQGDIKLVVALTAWLSGAASLSAFLWACFLCWGLESLKQRTWRPSGACAFGPYLFYGALLVWLLPNHFVFYW